MNNYMIITLENEIKCAVIDVLKYDDRSYFLISKMNDDRIDRDFIICEYDELENCFKEVENQEDLEVLFNERLNSKQRVLSYFDDIKKEMIKLHVLDINSNLYLLKDDNGNIREKTIILINEKININDYIYLLESVINEDNIFTYGKIYNWKSTKKEEIMIIEKDDTSIILQKYYG